MPDVTAEALVSVGFSAEQAKAMIDRWHQQRGAGQPDDLAQRRRMHAVQMAHASGRRRRIDIGDVVTYDPAPVTSQVRGVWQDGPCTRVLIDLESGPCWVLSSDCTAAPSEATDA